MAAINGVLGGSSTFGESDLPPRLVLDENVSCDEARRMIGDRGGVVLSMHFKELYDVRLVKVGVGERSLVPMDRALGALLRGVLVERFALEGDEGILPLDVGLDKPAGEEGGRGVAAAVERDNLFNLFERAPPSLFVG